MLTSSGDALTIHAWSVVNSNASHVAVGMRDRASAMNVNEGELLAGKFRIERVLGRGGMGVVVAATHVHLGERVALKFLLPESLQNPEAVQRFAREARAAVRIKSEHVARVSDVGTLENGAPYMVMELATLKRRGPGC